jgi:hypothetical protein
LPFNWVLLRDGIRQNPKQKITSYFWAYKMKAKIKPNQTPSNKKK